MSGLPGQGLGPSCALEYYIHCIVVILFRVAFKKNVLRGEMCNYFSNKIRQIILHKEMERGVGSS